MPYDQFAGLVAKAHKAGLQLFIHANGDGAIQQAIKAVEAAGIKAGDDSRTIVIHSQMQRPEDLPKYAALGMTPSYFTMHTFFWAMCTARTLARRARLSSARWSRRWTWA